MDDFISKHKLALFFLMVIPLAWIWWVQMVLGIWPAELIIIPSTLGGISPVLTLWVLEMYTGDEAYLTKTILTAKNWRISISWLILAAIALPLICTIGNILNYIIGLETHLNLLSPGPAELGLALIPIIPLTFFPGLLSSPLLEEPGWRGFALPLLQAKFGREIGSLIIGSYWWLWHQMSNLSFGIYPTLLGYLSMLSHSFAIDSMYNLSQRNVLTAMFAHQSMFIMFTYLYRTANEIASLVIICLTWVFVMVLRLREKGNPVPSLPR
ncbi:MAG: CPBP family intramembrane glutamic endopeptidase [Promethearchaeota archaeon]